MADDGTRIEPAGRFALLRAFAPGAHESVTENLGLRGYGDLARYLWAERMFDRRYGVRTEYLVAADQLDFDDDEVKAAASRYRATPPYCVQLSLARLRDRLGDLSGSHLVDYGSGAGRVMILAAEAGIGRVTGVEFSPSLVAQCRENLDRYGSDCDFEVLEQDATLYMPPPDANIFYFFNPFSPAFFERAVDNIRRSVRADPRVIYLMLFQTFRYPPVGLDLIGSVTGVQTWSNLRDPERFVAEG